MPEPRPRIREVWAWVRVRILVLCSGKVSVWRESIAVTGKMEDRFGREELAERSGNERARAWRGRRQRGIGRARASRGGAGGEGGTDVVGDKGRY
jgi:hypothetical protein